LSRNRLALAGAGCLLPLLLQAALSSAAPIVTNDKKSLEGVVTVQLSERWRIGGEDDEDNLLGVVNQVLTDDQGNTYLLDIQLVEVQVFDADGIYSGTLGQRGDGPGEVRNAFGEVFLPDGTLGLIQGFPGRIVKIDLAGTPAGEFRPGGEDPAAGGFFVLRSSASFGNRLVLGGMKVSRGDNSRTATHFIAAFDPDETESARYLEKVTVRDFGRGEISEKDEYFPAQGKWALGRDGRVYVAAERNEYRIDVYSPDGTLERSITRAYDSRKRSESEMETAREMIMPAGRRGRNNVKVVVEPTEPDILNLRIDPEGWMWVLPGRGVHDQEPGVHSTWDVFDPEGTFVRQVAFACEGDGAEDALFFDGGQRAYLVREHAQAMFAFRGRGADNPADGGQEIEARPLEVICYEILP